jgi:hypothetical protein
MRMCDKNVMMMIVMKNSNDDDNDYGYKIGDTMNDNEE